MWKAVCLALACLLGLGAVLALVPAPGDRARALSRTAAALPMSVRTAAIDEADESAAVVNTSSKGDKLPITMLDVAAHEKVPVETTKIAPVQIETPTRSVPKAREITSWRWHAGSNKIERH
jgi:hypothetical protein